MEDRTLGERVSDYVASFGGSWFFVISFTGFLICWVIFNTLAFFDVFAWDKPPFILLNLILSFIAAFQAPFIMMSQNRSERKQDIAYRAIFLELKELVEQDLAQEAKIHADLSLLKCQLNVLFQKLQQAIKLEEMNRKDIAELLEHHEESESSLE